MLRFIKGNRYRHKHCLDVDIQVLSAIYYTPSKVALTVIYLNRNYEGGDMMINPPGSSPGPETKVFSPNMNLWKQVIKKDGNYVTV